MGVAPPSPSPIPLSRLAHLHQAERRRLAASHGLSIAQLDALHYLARCNRYSDTPVGVAEYLSATKGTVSQTVTALVDKGLVEKHADAADGRVSHCRVTAQGKRLVNKTQGPSWPTTPEVDQAVAATLRALQKANGFRSFGVCHTCIHHQREGATFRCGLTQERLTRGETEQICREHESAA